VQGIVGVLDQGLKRARALDARKLMPEAKMDPRPERDVWSLAPVGILGVAAYVGQSILAPGYIAGWGRQVACSVQDTRS
jgi:hypothetical protein